MSSTSNLRQSSKERIGFVIFASLVISLIWLVHSGASNSAKTVSESPRVQNKKQPPSGCPSCPPPSSRRIYAPAIELNEAQSCEIVLNSRSANPIDVTPTFYTASGDAIVGNPIQLQPSEIRFAPVEELMPESIRRTHRWGGIALSYTGHVLEVWAQITFHGIGGGSIDETFNILEEPGSDTREAVWLMPRKGTAIIALGNTSPVAIHTTAQFLGEAGEDLEIPAGVTKFIRRKSHGRDDDAPESVKLTTVGPDGALRVAGFIVGDDNDFASSIRFYDTKKTVQSNLYAVNLRLRNAKPRIVLENTSDTEISAQPKFSPLAGDQSSAVELPNVTIGPRQIVELDLAPFKQAASSRTDLDSVYAQILSSAAPGSLIGAAYSEQNATGLIYDVPLRDSGKNRNGTGSYPWRVDNDYSTNVVLTNVGNIPAKFQVELRYPGGPYSIKQRELAVGESASFDLRAIRDEQQPDRTGKTLPETINGGQFHWSIVQTPGDARIVGRAEVVSRSQHIVSSYSCPVCCQDNGPNAYFNPNAYPLYVDGIAAVGADGTYWDCYYNYYTGSASFTSLSTLNISVATANSATSELQGVDVGGTDVVGEYQYVYWEDDGMNCYQRYDNGSTSAPVDVQCRVPTGETSGDVGWSDLDPTMYKYEQTLTASGNVSFVGRTVTEQDPGGGGPDTCNHSGDPWDPFDHVDGSSWPVVTGNKWHFDSVGYKPGAVSYYRNQGRAPCGTSFQQRMVISCSSGNPIQYKTNTLSASFTSTQVTASRAGNSHTKTWP